MSDAKTSKTLSDDDIATRMRRPGPTGAAPGTDADAHATTDADARPAAAAAKDADAKAATDHDGGRA